MIIMVLGVSSIILWIFPGRGILLRFYWRKNLNPRVCILAV